MIDDAEWTKKRVRSGLGWPKRLEEALSRAEAAEAELQRMKNRPVEAEYVRLDTMWQSLVAERDRLRAALEAYPEWVPMAGTHACPLCDRTQGRGHAPDCARQRALGREP